MPRKKAVTLPEDKGSYSFAFDVIETDEEHELVKAFLEHLNEATGGDILTGFGWTAVVRTADKALITLLGRCTGVQRPQKRKDEQGRTIFSFPMLLPKELTALEELVNAASRMTNSAAEVETGKLIVCQTRSKDLASVLKQYASPIDNDLVDFGLGED